MDDYAEGYDDGYEHGYEAGVKESRREISELRRALANAVNALNQVPELTVAQANAAIDWALKALRGVSDE